MIHDHKHHVNDHTVLLAAVPSMHAECTTPAQCTMSVREVQF